MKGLRAAVSKDTFLKRWRGRRLTQQDVKRGFFILLSAALPAGLAGFLFEAESAINDAVWPVIFGLGFSFLICLGFLAYSSYSLIGKQYGRFIWSFFPITAAVFFSLVFSGYLFWFNAFSGSWSDVTVSGPITQIRSQGKGRTSYYVKVNYNGRPVELSINWKEYQELRPGYIYAREMKLGGLGYYWNWRFW